MNTLIILAILAIFMPRAALLLLAAFLYLLFWPLRWLGRFGEKR